MKIYPITYKSIYTHRYTQRSMEITSKVRKFVGERKVVEIPLAVRKEFSVGEKVLIRKFNEKRRR